MDGMAENAQAGRLAFLSRLGLAAGAFAIAVSFSLFIHSVSQLSSPIVSALFIAGGIVGRRRVPTDAGQALAVGTIAGGVVAAIASLALAASGH
jgi:hypothetical protein